MANTIAQQTNTTWLGRLNALTAERDSFGLKEFLDEVERSNQKAAWHSARLRFVHQHWKQPNLSSLAWLRDTMGPSLWTGLSVSSSWTLDIHDTMSACRKAWHSEILGYNDARGIFKSDPRSIEIIQDTPKLSWLIAAMQATKPRAYPALDTYRPGAFAYFEVLQMTGENPMDNAQFRAWILDNKKPGFSEEFKDLDSQNLFNAPG